MGVLSKARLYSSCETVCYCAFCREKRRVNLKKSISLVNVIQAAVLSYLGMMALWREFDARVFFIFAVVISLTEILLLVRWRFGVICPHCGFDPVLYLKSPEQVVTKVQAHLKRYDDNPKSSLTPSPRRNLPVVIKKNNEARG
ncbi:MAG: hypothetical protein SGJ18_09070 [Pseudomonadota bacterium]|nr:hypothetical protein [Pseudomonadota bacterium]